MNWQSAEQAPPHEGRYLATDGKWVGFAAWLAGDWLRMPGYDNCRVTHWMLIPKPPTVGDERG